MFGFQHPNDAVQVTARAVLPATGSTVVGGEAAGKYGGWWRGFITVNSAHIGQAPSPRTRRRRLRAGLLRRPLVRASLLVVVVAGLDLISAAWARAQLSRLAGSETGYGLGLVTNRGMALGIADGHPGWSTALSAVMVLVLAAWLARARPTLQRAGLSLALGGGLGNLIDRLIRGSVTDWIHVAGYPATFNLADVAIRAGLLLVLIDLLLTGRHRRPSRGPA